MAHGHAERIEQMVEAAAAGRSVEIRGRRLAGRTHLLGALAAGLTARGIPWERVDASVPLRRHPYGALRISGLAQAVDPAAGDALLATVVAVEERLARSGTTVLLVDDADHLDPHSVAVLRHLESRGLVLASTRRTDCPDGHAAPVFSAMPLVLDAPALTPTELLVAMRDRLGNCPAPELLAELFAHSLGTIGIAARLLEDGLSGGSIELVGDVWDHTGESSPVSPLDALWNDYLHELSEEDRDCLTAIVTIQDGTELDRVLEDASASLARLASLGHLRIVPCGDRRAVIVPSLLADHLRRRSGLASASVFSGRWRRPPIVRGTAPQRHSEFNAREVGWRAQTIRQLHAVHHREPSDLLTQVLTVAERSTRLTDPSALEVARHELADLRDESTDVALAVDASIAALTVRAGLEHQPSPPPDVADAGILARAKACEARLLVAMARGRLDATGPDLLLAAELTDQRPDVHVLVPRLAGLRGMVSLFRGDPSAARDVVRSVLDGAAAPGAQHTIAHLGSTVAALVLLDGRHQLAREYVETVLSLPRPCAVNHSCAVQLATVLAFWDEDVQLAGALRAWSSDAPEVGPDPYESAAWVRSAALRASGRAAEASTYLLEQARVARTRGWNLTAAVLALHAVDIHPNARAESVARQSTHDVQSPLLDMYIQALVAYARQDVAHMVATYRDPRARMAAVMSYRLALVTSRATTSAALAETLRLDLAEFRRRRPDAVFVAERVTTGPPLTPREREVVLAVAAGRTSADVAREQFVSVRTVESHLHRAMRKLGATRRTELRDLADQL
jgi:DNA-binding CsgD family transcriptional regulator